LAFGFSLFDIDASLWIEGLDDFVAGEYYFC